MISATGALSALTSPIVKPSMVNARNRTYLALVVFVVSSVLLAGLVWTHQTPPVWTYIVQLWGVMEVTDTWEHADAEQRGIERSSAADLFTMLLPPLGHAVYLVQSRSWQQAAVTWLRYWTGVAVAVGIAAFVAAALM